MSRENVIEKFYGVYLLYCTNPKYKGRTYIGYTVDPNRRIKQHNKGKHAGGAWRTSNRGPWEMVLIIHGFPNDISALRFEWAWQHPYRSRRLRHVQKKKSNEKTYDFNLRVLSEMLCVGPWHRLPLTIRWLKQEYAREFPASRSPPMHMPVVYGPVATKKIPSTQTTEENNDALDETLSLCSLCSETVTKQQRMTCLNPKCLLMVHVICLANLFVPENEVVPVDGQCPACKIDVLWGDLVRKKNGCYRDLNNSASEESE
ncbi:Structure-specific endonuclease subunit SLX1 homolog [Gryllus bimaculatus]|nr:Structure-specific endonuclease subunit SLX1 homolog [Gryllus bimaculatus]